MTDGIREVTMDGEAPRNASVAPENTSEEAVGVSLNPSDKSGNPQDKVSTTAEPSVAETGVGPHDTSAQTADETVPSKDAADDGVKAVVQEKTLIDQSALTAAVDNTPADRENSLNDEAPNPATTQSVGTGSTDGSFLSSVGQIPIAAAAVDHATALYAWAKAQNEYVRMGLERGETITKGAAAAIAKTSIAQSVATKLSPLDMAAHSKLEQLKQSYPLINTAPEELYQMTRERLGQLGSVQDYTQVAKQAEDLLKTQLQHNYDIAKTKTNDLVKTMQEQTHAMVEYSKGLNLEQATADMKKAFESAQEYVSSTLAEAQEKARSGATAAKETFETRVSATQSSEVLAGLQQQLEGLKTQLDGLLGTIKSTMGTQQQALVESLHARVDDALKAWMPVKDHLLAYFVAKNDKIGAVSPPTTTNQQ